MSLMLFDGLYAIGGIVVYLTLGMLALHVTRRMIGDAQKGYIGYIFIWPMPMLFLGMVGLFVVVKKAWASADAVIEWTTRPRR